MQLGLIGLGTMGASLARNALRNGVKVSVFNRTTETMEAFAKEYENEGDIVPCATYEELCASLMTPRVILLMVKAGSAVDAVIEDLLPLLEKGDILVDGGNSLYIDTQRRVDELRAKGIHYVGMGVSGGEEGALHGPSMMPGGDEPAWKSIAPLFTKMAADDGLGGSCVSFLGQGGAGHFVKMVHNGIEYGIMQIIAESYDLLKNAGGLRNEALGELFSEWNASEDLSSFLLEITAKIFTVDDSETGSALLDVIQDRAKQKGTGKWTTEAAMQIGVAIPTINAAVDARILSGAATERTSLQGKLPSDLMTVALDADEISTFVRSALELSTLIAYKQGMDLIAKMSDEENWSINLSEVARIWRGGCIIRSNMLPLLQEAYGSKGMGVFFAKFAGEKQRYWRDAITVGTRMGIGLPAMSASLAYYDSLRRERLPQNLVQAQRDFFGAHTYERVDKEGVFHAEWE